MQMPPVSLSVVDSVDFYHKNFLATDPRLKKKKKEKQKQKTTLLQYRSCFLASGFTDP